MIDNCAHPDYRSLLDDYLDRAERSAYGRHTPHMLDEALAWHARFVHTGRMAPQR
jgi:succinyl-CoA:acetate CoA-transferase